MGRGMDAYRKAKTRQREKEQLAEIKKMNEQLKKINEKLEEMEDEY
jgi:uncharacterized FlaG/YvyC family protein